MNINNDKNYLNLKRESFKIVKHNLSIISIRNMILLLLNLILSANLDSEETSNNPDQLKKIAYNNIIENPNTKKILAICNETHENFLNYSSICDGQIIGAAENFAINLSGFWYLDLSNLDIDDIPKIIYIQLRQLRILKLANNPRISLNADWFKILGPRLTELDISNCDLQSNNIQQLEICKDLRILKISGNTKITLNSDWFKILGPRLTELDISNCDLQSNNIQQLEICKDLRILKISGNTKITLNSDWFKKLGPRLTELDISNSDLQNIDIQQLEICKNLRILKFANNHGITLNSNWFKILGPRLTELDISNCDLQNIDIQQLEICKNLRILNISGNTGLFTDHLDLSSLEKLSELYASGIFLNKFCFMSIIQMENLEILDISNNGLYMIYKDLNSFGNLEKTLKSLNLSLTGLRFKDMAKIQKFNILEKLDISRNYLSDSESFIRDIRLDKKSIKGSYREFKPKDTTDFVANDDNIFLDSLSTKLIELNVNNCNISSSTLVDIFKCTNLEILNCSHNDLSNLEIINWNWTIKESLKEISLKSCSLNSSDFLKELFHFQKLEKLEISNNHFQSLNFDFKDLTISKTLKYLDMENVGLEAYNIFQQLSGFSCIECLNLSYNHIEDIKYDCCSDLSFEKNKNNRIYNNPSLLQQSLKILYLKNDQILIPSRFLFDITNCSNLMILDLSGTLLEKVDSQFNFGISSKTIRELYLTNCGLKDDIVLKKIVNFKELEILDISHNLALSFSSNFKFKEIKNTIKQLFVNKCYCILNKLMYEVAKCDKIEILDISSNILLGVNKEYDFGIAKKTLKVIKASYLTNRKSFFMKILKNCKHLEELDMSQNLLNNLLEKLKFSDIPRTLKKLNISSNEFISEQDLIKLRRFKALTELDISNNRIANVTENFDFKYLKYSLKKVKAANCDTNKNLIDKLLDCENLEELNIENTNPEYNIGTFKIGKSKRSLKELNICRSEIYMDEAIRSLYECEKLSKLKISGRFKTKDFSEFTMGKLKETLKVLEVCDCNITTTELFKKLTNCPKLKYLDISACPYANTNFKIVFGISKESLQTIKLNFKRLFLTKSGLFALTSCPRLRELYLLNGSYLSQKYIFGISKHTLTDLCLPYSNHLPLSNIPYVYLSKCIKQCSNLQKSNFVI